MKWLQRANLPDHFPSTLSLSLLFLPILNEHIFITYSAIRHLKVAEPLLFAGWIFRAPPLWPLCIAGTASCAVAFMTESYHWLSGAFSLHHLLGILEKFMWWGCRQASVVLSEQASLICPGSPYSEQSGTFSLSGSVTPAAQRQPQSTKSMKPTAGHYSPVLRVCSLAFSPYLSNLIWRLRPMATFNTCLWICISCQCILGPSELDVASEMGWT